MIRFLNFYVAWAAPGNLSNFSISPGHVIPAKAGIHEKYPYLQWIPAFAGMTETLISQTY